ncbi:MAG: flagellar basal body P-ring formation protein FlgA [Phycisphaerae bacterium]|nr:flagellar basal body P-ring formation protein FlgA [Phycisphaerae bacterium]
MNRLLIAMIALLSLAAVPAPAQDSVVMRSAARLAAGSPIRVGDVATVSGPESARIAAVTLDGPAGSTRGRDPIVIDPARVRRALEDAGMNPGRVTLRGGPCTVARGDDQDGPKPHINQPALPPSSSTPADAGPNALKAQLVRRLAQLYGVDPTDVRLTLAQQDQDLLAADPGAARVEFQPGASRSSPKMPVRINLYDGDRLISSRTVSPEVKVRRRVVVAAAELDRGQSIGAPAVTLEVRWINPSLNTLGDIEAAIGAETRARVAIGQVLEAEQLDAPLVCKRGDPVVVHCLSGSVAVKVRARAQAAARDGELVELRVDGSKRSFTGRMSGKGRAVMIVGGAADEIPVPATTAAP